MPWSNWIHLAFQTDGTLDTSPLSVVPRTSGVYAIASSKPNGFYVTHYVGRSVNIRERLSNHLHGRGNKIVAMQLDLKKTVPVSPANICVAYLETSEPKIVEALFIDTTDLPICNIYRARLPNGLSEWSVRNSELER